MALKAIVDGVSKSSAVILAKEARNKLFYRIFQFRGRMAGRQFARQLRAAGASRVCITIAFNTPWAIDALTRAWELRPPGMVLVVVDNSTKSEARQAIARICRMRDVPYLGLPMRTEKHWSRSHGTAITWAYDNVIKRLKPELFGFIDHDCFPIVPFDIPSRLEGKTVYGRKASGTENFIYKAKPGDRQWNLWAGFCFYRFSVLAGCKLNFEPRLNLGLDTGGANWALLYSKLDDADVVDAPLEQASLDLGGYESRYECIDGAFFHPGGVSYANMPTKHHRSVEHRQMLRNYIWDTYLGGASGQTVTDF